jgi:hypothetical protein
MSLRLHEAARAGLNISMASVCADTEGQFANKFGPARADG